MLAGGCYWSSPGGLPVLLSPRSERGGRTKIIQLRKQNATLSIIEVREKLCFGCTGEVDQSDQHGFVVPV